MSQNRGLLTVISMFSGCGGMDLGFRGGFEFFGRKYRSLPFKIIWANDINAKACNTYRRNLGLEIKCGDIWGLMNALPNGADVLIGCFPCQDISVNGKRSVPYDNNANLLKHDLTIPLRAIEMGADGAGSSAPKHRHLTQKEDPMDADQLKRKWVQFKGALKTRWSRFRDGHLVQCEESYDQVVDKAHERYRDQKNELLKGADQRHQQSAPEAVGEYPAD